MQKLTLKEKLVALAGLSLISASITFVDWWQRGQGGSVDALLAGSIAIVVLFWLPVSLGYYLVNQLGKHRVFFQLLTWLACFYLGYCLWAVALEQLYSSVQLSWLNTFFICLPWAVGTFIIYRAYGAYKALQTERLLRKQMELNQLKQTLHPHFLFNSLNTLSAFIASNPNKAEQLTQDLASVLRQILDTDKKEAISLKHELLVLQKWLNIEQARLGDDLTVNFHINDETFGAHLPPFILQPLLENAIKHAQKLPVCIELRCDIHNNKLRIEVRDNGSGFPQNVIASQGQGKEPSGLGLRTTLQRIKLITGAQFSLTNGPAPYGAVIRIELDFKHA